MERANLYMDDGHARTAVSPEEKRLISPQPALPEIDIGARPSTQEIGRAQLINKLNYLNFLEKPLYVNFRHTQYERFLTIKARPQPCQDSQLTCLWQQDATGVVGEPESFRFHNIIIPDGRRFLVAEPEVVKISHEAICLVLPEFGRAAEARRTRRYPCRDINVYVTQNGALYYGTMIDCSAFSFRVQVRTLAPQTFDWIDTAQAVNVILFAGDRTLYSGDCRILKRTCGHHAQDWILNPLNRQIRRFRAKTFRSTRQRMRPLPTIGFIHPLSKRQVHRDVIDISGSGIAVVEEHCHAVLLPGLIIPRLQIFFGNGAQVTCTAQVVYSQSSDAEGEDGLLRCGIAFLDMPADEHVRVLSLIQQAGDKNAHLCHRVDLDDLWNFFFETGFIYPQKYEFIEKNKARIKATYQKLYTEAPSIARHFIHQCNGTILAHMAMVRFYEKAWLIHHHAAIRSSRNRGGLAVLNQIGSFINDSHRLDAIRMSYVFCYYRPDNKFPNHVFGGAAKNIQSPKGCSIDRFAYSHFRKAAADGARPPDNWHLAPVTRDDLRDFEYHYEAISGGLMIQAMDLGADNYDIAETEAAFRLIGLTRSRHLFSLKMGDRLKAVIVINIADIGLNMSDLTNSVKVIILERAELTAPIIQAALASLFDRLGIDEMPVLTWPEACASELMLPNEKTYNLWILNMNHTDAYFRYLKRLLKFIKH